MEVFFLRRLIPEAVGIAAKEEEEAAKEEDEEGFALGSNCSFTVCPLMAGDEEDETGRRPSEEAEESAV